MKSLLAVLVLVTQAMAQKCFSMDGQQLDSRYQPCYPDAESSACCMLNGTQGDNQQNDICLDSGLCQSTSGWYAGFLYINGCTDQSSKASGCAKLCSFMGNQYSWNVLQCNPGKFCCRAASDTGNCCNDNSTIISTSHIGSVLLPGTTSVVNTTYNTTQASSTINTTCTSASAANLIDPSQCPADKSATVGGAVGGLLGAALIGAIIALVITLQGRKKAKSQLHSTQTALVSAQAREAKENLYHQKQLEEQRHMRSTPPNYHSPIGYQTRPPLNEIGSNESHGYSELGGADDSRAELTSDTAKPQ